jgi:alpha-mannosidase
VSNAYELIGTLKAYKQKEILRTSALHTSGNGDGGGGITEEMAWNLNLMAELPRLQDVPRLTFPSLTELFEGIHAKRDELPIWDDELYLEYHRGTLTTQEEVKRQNRQLEAHLHNVEWLLVVASSVCGVNIRSYTVEVEKIWEDTLLFHFHDAIPGSSVNEANQDIIKRGRPHLARLSVLEGEIAGIITAKMRTATIDNAVVVFNTLSHDRKVDGQIIPSGGWTVQAPSTRIGLDTQETTTYERIVKNETFEVHTLQEPTIDTSVPPSSRIQIDKRAKTVTTPFFVVSFEQNGTIRSVVSAATGREYLSAPGNQFELYEDRPLNWPAWDIQLYHKEMQIESPVLASLEFGDDCVRTNHTITRVGDGPAETSTITQIITFSADSPTIDFKTVVNWTQHSKLLKVAFPTTVRARSARFGIQFGHIERPTHKNTERDLAKFEAAGRWADLSDSGGGLSLCSNVKAGFDIHEGVVRMSLLKAPLQTDKWADFGIRKFTYRAAFHDGFAAARTVALSDELNTPVVLRRYEQPARAIAEGDIPITAEFVVVADPDVVLETLKPAFDGPGFVARFYEAAGGWRRTRVTFPLLDAKVWSVEIVDALERRDGTTVAHTTDGQLAFELPFNAFELTAVLIVPGH